MSRWFRLYDDTLNDPKILKLSDKTYRVWIGILCVASKNNGELPPFEDMALMLRMKPEKFQPELEKLIISGLIDHDDDGLRPHNWQGRQYKSDVSTERVKRFRNGKRNVSEAPPDTEQNTETETEKKYSSLRSRSNERKSDWPTDFREQFWSSYPRKTERLAAMKALEKAHKIANVPWEKFIEAVRRYAATADPNFTKHPATWLNKGCWDDQTGGSSVSGNSSKARKSHGSDFFAGLAAVAADISGNGTSSRAEAEEIPVGRVNIEH